MNEQPLVSIIVPTHRRTDMLSRALESLLAQTYSNIEVVLVNDNGLLDSFSNELSEIVNKYGNLFNSFKYVVNEYNMGGSVTRNIGVEESSGNLVTFLDDDDIYLPTKIEKQVQLFNSSNVENLVAVYCQIRTIDQKSGKVISEKGKYYKGSREPLIRSLYGTLAGTPSILVDKERFLNVGGFRDLKTGEDWCFILDLLLAGGAVDFNEEFLVEAYIHDGERISTSDGKMKGKLSENLVIKEQVIRTLGLSEEETAKVYFHHYYSLASMFKYSNKALALKYISKATKYSFNIKELSKFSFGYIFGKKATIFVSDVFRK